MLVAVILVACSANSATRTPTPIPHSWASASPSPKAGGRLQVTLTTSIERSSLVQNLYTWASYVVWLEGPTNSSRSVEAVLYDVRSRQLRVIAQASTPTAVIVPVVGGGPDGADVAYVELAHPLSDQSPDSPWTLYLLDLNTGGKRAIASNPKPSAGLSAPFPDMDEHWVAWAQLQPQGQLLDIKTLDLTSGVVRTVAVGVATASVSVNNGVVYFDNGSASSGRDVFSVPANGSAGTSQVTHSGHVLLPNAKNGTLSWQEPELGDPTSTWALDLNGGKSPTKVADGPNGDTHPGPSFVAWLNFIDSALEVGSLHGGPTVTVEQSNLSLPAAWNIAGNRLVWATRVPSTSRSTVHLAIVG